MLLQELNPFLRCAVRFRYARVHSVRCPADARILYVTDGLGKLWLEGTEHPLCAGTLALIGPGVYASHSYERAHMDAVEGTFRVLQAYIA